MGLLEKIKKLFSKKTLRLAEHNFPDAQLTIEETPEDIENKEKEKKALQKNLMRFGITNDEWTQIEKYKSTDYFVSNTLLHNIDLFKLQRPAYADVFNELLDPQQAIDFYCKIYSAMYKYGMIMREDKTIYRVGSKLFHDEIKKSGKSESLLSFATDGYHSDFFRDKNNPIIIQGVLKRGTPCIDFKELYGYDVENEILLPPFLQVDYEFCRINTKYNCEQYIIDVKKSKIHDKDINLDKIPKEIEQFVTSSKIPEEYYRNWYAVTASNPSAEGNDAKSIELREKFLEWQNLFKIYLQYKFREIENELDRKDDKIADNIKVKEFEEDRQY